MTLLSATALSTAAVETRRVCEGVRFEMKMDILTASRVVDIDLPAKLVGKGERCKASD